ncbi:MAG: cation:proton antiporter [Lentisphaeria bacterium]|nr:cation:proton antiporter [Lentisphaeria bacterium]
MSSLASDLMFVVLSGCIGGLIANFFRQPLIIGYILAGVVLGPFAGINLVDDVRQIEYMADVGVALLLFTLGLEFPLKSIRPIQRIAIWGALLQVALTFVGVFGLGLLLDFPGTQAMWLAAALVSSSTTVILKTLSNRKVATTLSGRVMLGMSIVQDLLVIPIMIVISNFDVSAGTEDTLIEVGKSVFRALTFVAVMIFIGSKIFKYLLERVSRLESRELFLLSITALGLGVGYITHLFGLSFAFGAFVGGMVLSESDYSRKAVSELIPLRDIFGLLFFVTAGMLLNLPFMWSNIGIILLVMFGGISLRGVILSGVNYLFGYRRIIPLAVFFGMLPISEISFVLIQQGKKIGAIDYQLYNIILSSTIISMIIGPLFSGLTAPIYNFFNKFKRRESQNIIAVNLPADELQNHVVIAGSNNADLLSDTLRSMNLKYVIIEDNYRRFSEYRERGVAIIYGDPSQDFILQSATIGSAKLLIVATGDSEENVRITREARNLNSSLKIIVQADNDDEVKSLGEQKIFEVINPAQEVSLEMLRQALLSLSISIDEVRRFLAKIRAAGQLNTRLNDCLLPLLVDSINTMHAEIPADSSFVKQSLKELNWRKLYGVTVIGVLRNEIMLPNPSGEFVFLGNDHIILMGNEEKFAEFREVLAKSNKIEVV